MRLAPAFSRLLAAFLAAGAPCLAQAQTITNVAQARWTDGARTHEISSNRVTVEVTPGSVSLQLLRVDPAAPEHETINGRSCPAAAGAAMANVEVGVATASTLNQGDYLVISVVAPAANLSATAIDTVTATVTATGSGDRETLTLHETGVDTGMFTGLVATAAVPPAPTDGDCTLGLIDGDQVTVSVTGSDARVPLATQAIGVPVDPRGKVFDANDGAPVNGARVTIVDADSGAPAPVFASDLVTSYPSTVVSGQPTTDAAGTVYPARPGMYQFPRVRPGRYRLVVQPPAPYRAPAIATPAELAALTRPNGKPFTIADGSFGRPFTIDGSGLIRLDIPVDTPAIGLVLTKLASRPVAARGDGIIYTISVSNPDATHQRRALVMADSLPAALLLSPGSVRIDGATAATGLTLSPDGRGFTLALARVDPGKTIKITYAVQVRADAASGAAVNHAALTDSAGNRTLASVAVRITDETIAGRMTLIGRVVAGCDPRGTGVPGVRVMLEDGSYAVTDRDGRYHFDGLVPGDHVAEVDAATLPAGGRFVDCAASTRSAGNAVSRFVSGQGGALVIADFTADLTGVTATAPADDGIPAPVSDRTAAGGERDWFAERGGVAWLFPAADHNPRAPAVRVAIRHLPGQTVELTADGRPVDPIAFDGTRESPDRSFSVSLWRGVPLAGATTHLTATVRDASGAVAQTLTRDVHFMGTAARVTMLPERSRLIADGVARLLIAVRVTDAAGRPVHAGSVGELQLGAPYEAAQAIDAEQARVLSGLERASPTWRVAGDDGVAYIALAPTTTSGAVQLDFAFRDREQLRRQRLDAWLSPGDRQWTVVGLATGRLGRHVEPDRAGAGSLVDGRLALYAKGRIRGRWLLTLAYDSARRRQDQRLAGVIDPDTYYTVYADRSERRYDAASTRKLYLKLETRQFYALWGDFQTGFGDTELGRYQRAGTGLKAEYRGRAVAASAFAARFPTTHRRDEIQGNGLSVGYRLTTRPILANSEDVAIEVRDRLRSERIVERRTLTRFVDYDIDYATGALRFSAPVLSRSGDLDPTFIVADYEVDATAGDRVSAGARATWTIGGARLGATVVRDGDAGTNLAAVDARVRLSDTTELRAEAGGSRAGGRFGAAWTAELEHHDARLDVLAYARQLDGGFGLAEQNAAERGRRKIGVDARARLSERLSLVASLWSDTDLSGVASRRAAKIELRHRSAASELRAGVTWADDRTASGGHRSTLLELGATRRLWDGRLELDASSAVALGTERNAAASVDFPARHRLGARLQLSPDVALTGVYELAAGGGVDARTMRLGFDVKPWAGARLTSAVASQDIAEYGRRAFAAYGLAQSWPVTAHLSLDATFDGEHTLHGIDAARVVNSAQPVASGGYIGPDSGGVSALAEDFNAATLGATYRAGRWSVTARGEYRAGARGDRAALTAGAIRQLGEGATAGLLATWTRATPIDGAASSAVNIAGSLAVRPAGEAALLAKLEYRDDAANGVRARRAVSSLSLDMLPRARDGRERGELGVFLGNRYSFDRAEGVGIEGWSTMIGIDARAALGRRVELGLAATARGAIADGSFAYAYGPSLGVRPAKDMLVTAGWNVRGFADRDYADARSTRAGPYVTVKLKLDRNSFAFMGLGR